MAADGISRVWGKSPHAAGAQNSEEDDIMPFWNLNLEDDLAVVGRQHYR